MRHVIAIAVSLAAFAAFPAAAQHATQVSLPRVSLQGALVQGSLVVGKAAPGTRVQVDGIEVRVSTDGDFVLSFARNALPRYQLTLIPKQGLPETRTLEIRPRTWRVTKMKGLNVRRGKIPMNTGKGKTKPRKMTEAQRRAAAVRKVKIDREKRLIGKARGRKHVMAVPTTATAAPWLCFMCAPAPQRNSDVRDRAAGEANNCGWSRHVHAHRRHARNTLARVTMCAPDRTRARCDAMRARCGPRRRRA